MKSKSNHKQPLQPNAANQPKTAGNGNALSLPAVHPHTGVAVSGTPVQMAAIPVGANASPAIPANQNFGTGTIQMTNMLTMHGEKAGGGEGNDNVYTGAEVQAVLATNHSGHIHDSAKALRRSIAVRTAELVTFRQQSSNPTADQARVRGHQERIDLEVGWLAQLDAYLQGRRNDAAAKEKAEKELPKSKSLDSVYGNTASAAASSSAAPQQQPASSSIPASKRGKRQQPLATFKIG